MKHIYFKKIFATVSIALIVACSLVIPVLKPEIALAATQTVQRVESNDNGASYWLNTYSQTVDNGVVTSETKTSFTQVNKGTKTGEYVDYKNGNVYYNVDSSNRVVTATTNTEGDTFTSTYTYDSAGVLSTTKNEKTNLAGTTEVPASAQPPNTFGCAVSFTATFSGDNIMNCIAMVLYYIIMVPAGWLLVAAGALFDYTIKYTVVELGSHIKELTIIDTAWQAIRNIINIFFIFALLVLAFRYILGQKPNGRVFTSIIVAAFLINFSLFFVKFLIDVSNKATLEIYDTIVEKNSSSSSSSTTDDDNIAENIIATLKFESMFNNKSSTDETTIAALPFPKKAALIIFGGITMLVVAVVFVFAAIMFIVRYVALIFLLIFSATYFIGYIFPSYKQTFSGEYQKALQSQLLFPLVFFLLLYVAQNVSSEIIENLFKSSSSTEMDWIKFFTGDSLVTYINVIFSYVIVNGFIVGSIVMAKKVSDSGGRHIATLTKQVGGRLNNFAFGTVGKVGRGSVGMIGSRFADSSLVAGMRNSNIVGVKALGRGLTQVGDKVASSSFDARGSSMAGLLGLSGAKKGGYTQDVKERSKRRDERAERYSALSNSQRKQEDTIKNQQAELAEKEEKAKKQKDKINEKIEKENQSITELRATTTHLKELNKGDVIEKKKSEDAMKAMEDSSNQTINSLKNKITDTEEELKNAKTQSEKTALKSELDRLRTEVKDAQKKRDDLKNDTTYKKHSDAAQKIQTKIDDRSTRINQIEKRGIETHRENIRRYKEGGDTAQKSQIKTVVYDEGSGKVRIGRATTKNETTGQDERVRVAPEETLAASKKEGKALEAERKDLKKQTEAIENAANAGARNYGASLKSRFDPRSYLDMLNNRLDSNRIGRKYREK